MKRATTVLIFLLLAQWARMKETGVTHLTKIRPHLTPSKGRIIGGEEVVPHSFPALAGLSINGNSFCTGSLISPNYVLTAGHCGIAIRTVQVVLGAHNISNPDEETQLRVAGQKVILHPDYDDDFLYNDISLIQLAETVTLNEFINVAKLPSSSDVDTLYTNEISTAVGWGLVHDVDYPSVRDISDVLRSVDVQVSNLTECAYYYNDNYYEGITVTDNSICTSGYRNKGTCNGDSGGPLFIDGVLIGITSYGTDLCEVCSPSVYTRTANFIDWIAVNSDISV